MAGRPPTKDAPPFGQRLASARKAKGWSQQYLADLLGVTRELINYYERQAKNPSLDFIQRAAQILEVSMVDLIGEDDKPLKIKPGPVSQLEQRLERVKKLSRKEQEFILKLLDAVLEQHERAS
jgi:transcriptional regulator with XRE-family HTH domain